MLPRLSRLPLLGALLAIVLTGAPATALADGASSPAGASAVGAYLDLGAAHGCVLQKDRAVRCWGKGSSGRLGGGLLIDRLSSASNEASVLSLGQTTAVTAGDAHTCALLMGGAVRCWGQGGAGQLGTGSRDNRGDGAADPLSATDDASTVPLGGAATAISAGGEFTCAVVADGAVRCWGDGRFGALGSRGTDTRLDGLPDGPTDDPSTVPLGAAATAITAGAQHACALLAGGAVRCWGNGAEGRLGSGAVDDRLDGVTPSGGTDEASTVPLAEPATAISAGGAHTCAILTSGAVSCWGNNGFGQLGAGRTDARLDGVTSGSGTGATDAATTAAIKPLGTAQNRLATTPSLRATALAAGDLHTCAVVEGGDVRCWGQGTLGQLGQGATDHRLEQSATSLADISTRAAGGTNGLTGPGLGAPAVSVTAGYATTCAELATGAVRCWGDGTDGRLGSRATDARLDGVVDAGTGTDDASLVPVGPLPTVFGDLLTESAPTPATPSPAPPGPVTTTPAVPELSFKVSLKSRKATIAALLAPTKAGNCPKTVTVTVKEIKTTLGTAKLKTTKKGANCRVAGTIKLKRAAKKGKAITVAVRGKGVTTRTLKPTR